MATHLHHHSAANSIVDLLSRARAAQSSWRTVAVRERLLHLRRMRHKIGQNPQPLLQAIRLTRSGCSDSEILVSEVLPFLDAIKFLELKAEDLLRPARPAKAARPLWLADVDLEIHREPLGAVLVIAPSNYPLFLAGVQSVQALAAGNAALIKPGPGGSPAMVELQACAVAAGFPPHLLTILDESPETATEVIVAGVEKVWLTGSAKTGRAVAKVASETLTPLVCELSGCDAVILLPSADPTLAARAITFGLQLNQSQTCMRPHRVLVHQSLAAAFLAELAGRLANLRIRIDPEAATTLRRLLQDANRRGANQLQGKCDGQLVTPFVLSNVAPDSALCNAAIFAPVLAVNEFGSIEKAVQMHNACDYGLTASIFGRELQARSLVQQLNAGTVVINDLIVPTADSRLPFSGRKQSGYGSTRGAEGLLEFTRLKAVTVRRSQYRHLDTPHASDAALFSGVITALHGHGAVNRLRGAAHAIRAALRRNKRAKRSATHAQF